MAAPARQVVPFLEAVASREPTPGGGGVAAVSGALGASLASMVASYSIGRRGGENDSELREMLGALERARALLIELADADAEAWSRLSDALALSREDPARARVVAEAAQGAIDVPRTIQATCLHLLRSLARLAEISSPRLASDLATSALLLASAARGGGFFVRSNAPFLGDAALGERLAEEAAGASREAEAIAERIARGCS